MRPVVGYHRSWLGRRGHKTAQDLINEHVLSIHCSATRRTMNTVQTMVISFIVMVGVLISGGLARVEASEYLDEFCWNTEDADDPDGGVLKLGVTDLGGGIST